MSPTKKEGATPSTCALNNEEAYGPPWGGLDLSPSAKLNSASTQSGRAKGMIGTQHPPSEMTISANDLSFGRQTIRHGAKANNLSPAHLA